MIIMITLEWIFSLSGSGIYVGYLLLLFPGFKLKIFNVKTLCISLFGIGLLLSNLSSFFKSFSGDKLNETDFPLFVKLSLVRNIFAVIGQVFFAIAFYRAGYAKFVVNK